MFTPQDLARARHELAVRESEQMARTRRLVAARRAKRRAERTACIARDAALQASLAQSSLM
jgi:hypothetical protein